MSAQTRRARGARLGLIALGVGSGVALWSAATSRAEQETGKSSRDVLGKPRQEETRDSGSASTSALEKKLDRILANQETILQRFDQVMEELRIIKVRATIRGGS